MYGASLALENAGRVTSLPRPAVDLFPERFSDTAACLRISFLSERKQKHTSYYYGTCVECSPRCG